MVGDLRILCFRQCPRTLRTALQHLLAFPLPLFGPQELALHCQLHPAAVPLLARLPRLRRLTLYLLLDVTTGPRCCGRDPWGNPECIAAAVLPLLLGAPRLHRVVLATSAGDNDDPPANANNDETVQECVAWLQDKLRQMGRGSPTVAFRRGERASWAEDVLP